MNKADITRPLPTESQYIQTAKAWHALVVRFFNELLQSPFQLTSGVWNFGFLLAIACHINVPTLLGHIFLFGSGESAIFLLCYFLDSSSAKHRARYDRHIHATPSHRAR